MRGVDFRWVRSGEQLTNFKTSDLAAFNDDGDDGLGTNVTDDSTHEMSLDGERNFVRRRVWDFWGRRVVCGLLVVVVCCR